MPNDEPGSGSLVRGLGLVAATSVNIANMIGTGVFLKTRVMTCNVESPLAVMAVWIVSGLLALAGALTYSELAAMMPRAGGEYVILTKAYGQTTGYLYGWTIFSIAKTASQAALGIACAIFLNIVTGGALDGTWYTFHAFGHPFPLGWLQVTALAAIWTVTLINCAAVRVSGDTVSVLTFVKIALVLAVGAGAMAVAKGDWSHFGMVNQGGSCEGVSPGARGGLAGFGAAMLGALWAYDGWNNITPLSGEVRKPHRNLPLAFIGGMFIVGALYVFVNSAYFYVLTPTEVASVALSSSVATEVAKRFLGGAAVAAIAFALFTSSFGALHSSVMANSRVPYAMARDGMFFRALAMVSPRTHVPVRALIAQATWASVLALSGSYDSLTDAVIFASWILYGMTAGSVFLFRKRQPDAERPYRTWGYPVVPVLFLIVTAWLLINTLLTNPVQNVLGLLAIAAGLPLFWYFRARTRVGRDNQAARE
jgi:APA family basic amino acid/polyamine antiporter